MKVLNKSVRAVAEVIVGGKSKSKSSSNNNNYNEKHALPTTTRSALNLVRKIDALRLISSRLNHHQPELEIDSHKNIFQTTMATCGTFTTAKGKARLEVRGLRFEARASEGGARKCLQTAQSVPICLSYRRRAYVWCLMRIKSSLSPVCQLNDFYEPLNYFSAPEMSPRVEPELVLAL